MWNGLLFLGITLLVAAIIGGGVKMYQVELKNFDSVWRQTLLGVVGVVMVLTVVVHFRSEQAAVDAQPGPVTRTPETLPTAPGDPLPSAIDSPAPAATAAPTKHVQPAEPSLPTSVPDRQTASATESPRGSAVDGRWVDGGDNVATIVSGESGYFSYAIGGTNEVFRGGWRLNGSSLLVFQTGNPQAAVCRLEIADRQTMNGNCALLVSGFFLPITFRRID